MVSPRIRRTVSLAVVTITLATPRAAVSRAGRHSPQLGINLVDVEPAPHASFRGIVTHGDTGEPLQAALVYLNGTNVGALTNRLGEFSFDAPGAGPWMLSVDLIGYRQETETISVDDSARAVVRVALESYPVANCGLIVGVRPPPPRVRLVVRTEADSIPDAELEIVVRARDDETAVEVDPRDTGGYLEVDVGSIEYWRPLTMVVRSDDFAYWEASNVRLVGDPCSTLVSPLIAVVLRRRSTAAASPF